VLNRLFAQVVFECLESGAVDQVRRVFHFVNWSHRIKSQVFFVFRLPQLPYLLPQRGHLLAGVFITKALILESGHEHTGISVGGLA
jgi:hypothetical protein